MNGYRTLVQTQHHTLTVAEVKCRITLALLYAGQQALREKNSRKAYSPQREFVLRNTTSQPWYDMIFHNPRCQAAAHDSASTTNQSDLFIGRERDVIPQLVLNSNQVTTTNNTTKTHSSHCAKQKSHTHNARMIKKSLLFRVMSMLRGSRNQI